MKPPWLEMENRNAERKRKRLRRRLAVLRGFYNDPSTPEAMKTMEWLEMKSIANRLERL